MGKYVLATVGKYLVGKICVVKYVGIYVVGVKAVQNMGATVLTDR